MAQDRSRMRIGDAERDAAVEMLQEHHGAGRLDMSEYYTRMEKVLQARTQAEVDQMFTDLPEPKPAVESAPDLPQPVLHDTSLDVVERDYDPWYAQWWMILVAIGLTGLTDGRLGFLIPMMAIWIWAIYPSLESTKRRRRASRIIENSRHDQPYGKPHEQFKLTSQERRAIDGELRQGQKISAIKMYREFTGAGLKEAKDAIDRWDRRPLGY